MYHKKNLTKKLIITLLIFSLTGSSLPTKSFSESAENIENKKIAFPNLVEGNWLHKNQMTTLELDGSAGWEKFKDNNSASPKIYTPPVIKDVKEQILNQVQDDQKEEKSNTTSTSANSTTTQTIILIDQTASSTTSTKPNTIQTSTPPLDEVLTNTNTPAIVTPITTTTPDQPEPELEQPDEITTPTTTTTTTTPVIITPTTTLVSTTTLFTVPTTTLLINIPTTTIEITTTTTSTIDFFTPSSTATSTFTTTSSLDISTSTPVTTTTPTSTIPTQPKPTKKPTKVLNYRDSSFSATNFFIKNGNTNLNNKVSNNYLVISMANKPVESDLLIVKYYYRGYWHKLVTLPLAKERSNELNNGFIRIPLDHLETYQDLSKAQFLFTFRQDNNSVLNYNPLFIDAIWLETEIASTKTPLIKLASNQKSFDSKENAVFTFSYTSPPQSSLIKLLKKLKQTIVKSKEEKYKLNDNKFNISVLTRDKNNKIVNNLEPKIEHKNNNNFEIVINKKNNQLKPGKYKLDITIYDDKETITWQQDFIWGLMAFNTNKAIYQVDDKAYLQMAVLDEQGHTICDAELELQIASPNNGFTPLEVKKSESCQGDNVTSLPDYYSYYKITQAGKYRVKLLNKLTGDQITDSFTAVKKINNKDFSVERIGPTRIFPPADYKMTIKIKNDTNFSGEITETVPSGFAIKNVKLDGQTLTEPALTIKGGIGLKQIIIKTDLSAIQIHELSYEFNAPDISPYLFMLGPLQINPIIKIEKTLPKPISFSDTTSSTTSTVVNTIQDQPEPIVTPKLVSKPYLEDRQWQIASDAVDYIDPNADGNFTCSPTPSGDLYATVDEAIREPTTPNAGDYLSCNEDQYAYLSMTDITNASSTTAVDVYIYHNSGINMDLEVELWDSAETSQYGTTQKLNYSNDTNKWESVTFSSLSLSQAQVNDLKIKFTYTTSASPAISKIYSTYGVVTYSLANQPPTATDVVLNSGQDITLNPNDTVSVSATGIVSDPSGYSDIQNVSAKIFRSGVASAEECINDENNCYEISECSLSGCSGNSCNVTCATNIQFHAEPTSTSTPWSSESWRAWIKAQDTLSQTGGSYSPVGAPDIVSLTAMSLSTTTINFGGFDPGEQDTALNHEIEVQNIGNMSLNIEVGGNDLENPTYTDNIGIEYIRCSSSSDTSYSLGTPLTTPPGINLGVNFAKTTTTLDIQTQSIWFGIKIPLATKGDPYNGNIIINATAN